MSISMEKNAELAFLKKIKSKVICFFSDNDYVRQVDYTKGCWNPQRKLGVITHFSEINELKYGEKRWTGFF